MKQQSIALLTGLGLATSVMAQVDVTFTGATAFRSVAFNAIRTMYDGGVPAMAHYSNPGSPNSSTKAAFTGTMTPLFGSMTVVVRCSFSGSGDGIRDVANGNLLNFYASADPNDPTETPMVADLAFSDVFQSSTVYTTPTLDDVQVGVMPFVWCRSVATPATVANITHQQAQVFLANGELPLFYFTGDLNDQDLIHLIGRNAGSGTRMTAHADTGFGIFTTPQLWKLNPSNTAWVQDVGFSSGGSVRDELKKNYPVNISVGYLALGDASDAALTGKWLTYNGVAYTKDAVRNGQYSFWSYEHLFSRSSLGANERIFRDGKTSPAVPGLVAKIEELLASSNDAIQISTMMVSRNADGGAISP